MSRSSTQPGATAYFVAPYVEQSVPALKFASLYFDHIVLQQSAMLAALPEVTATGARRGPVGRKASLQMVDDQFLHLVGPLVQDNVLSVRPAVDARRDADTLRAVSEAVRELLSRRPDLIAEESATGSRNEAGAFIPEYVTVPREVRAVIEKHYGVLGPGVELPLDFMYAYYGTLLAESLCLMSEGLLPLSSSAVLDSCMDYVLRHDSVVSGWSTHTPPGSYSPKVAHELLNISLPDVSALSFEDLLEARDRLEPELQRLREATNRLTHSLVGEHDPTQLVVSLPEEVAVHVAPAVEELRDSIVGSRDRFLVDLVSSVAWAAPVPLLTMLLPGLPTYIGVLASLAAAAAKPVAAYVLRRRKSARNGLFGLIKLDRQLRRWTG